MQKLEPNTSQKKIYDTMLTHKSSQEVKLLRNGHNKVHQVIQQREQPCVMFRSECMSRKSIAKFPSYILAEKTTILTMCPFTYYLRTHLLLSPLGWSMDRFLVFIFMPPILWMSLGLHQLQLEFGSLLAQAFQQLKCFILKQGINRDRVEQMEARLKEDILLEAARYFLLAVYVLLICSCICMISFPFLFLLCMIVNLCAHLT